MGLNFSSSVHSFRHAAARLIAPLMLCLLLLPHTGAVSAEDTAPAEMLSIGILEAIDMALETDVSLRQTAESLRQQREDLDELKNPYSGSVSASHDSTYTNSTDDLSNSESVNFRLGRYFGDGNLSMRTNLSRTDGYEPYSTLLSMSYSHPLIKKSASRGSRIEDAMLSLTKSEENYVRQREGFILNIVRQYYEMRKIESLIEDNVQATLEARRQLRAVEIRYEAGVVAKIDVAKARIQLAESEQRELLARQGLEDARDAFALQLGLGLDDEYVLTDTMTFLPEEIDLEWAQRLLLESDDRLRDMRDDIDDSRRRLKYSRRERLPDLDLSAGWSASGRSDDFLESLEVSNPNLNVSLKMNWRTDLFNDSRTEQIRRQEIGLSFQEELYEIEEDSVLLDIRARLRGIRTQYLSLAQKELIFEEAAINLRLSQRSYEMQLGALSDVIEAQQDLLEAKEKLLDAQFSYFVDVLDLKQDMEFDIESLVRDLFDPARQADTPEEAAE